MTNNEGEGAEMKHTKGKVAKAKKNSDNDNPMVETLPGPHKGAHGSHHEHNKKHGTPGGYHPMGGPQPGPQDPEGNEKHL